MSSDGHVWAKVYLELPTDQKMVGRSAHDCYLWVCLILIAKTRDGVIPAWQANVKYLSKYARISAKEVAAALAYFEAVGMIEPTPDGGYTLPRFAKRQGSSDPKAAERMRTLRERSANVTPTRAGTDTDRSPNGLLTETEADTETEGAKRRTAAPRSQGSTVLDIDRARDDASLRGLFGDAFEAELQHFTDYWDSAGWKRRSGPVRDRNATWRNWLDSDFRKHSANGNGRRRENVGLAALAEWRQKMDEQEACIEGEVIRP